MTPVGSALEDRVRAAVKLRLRRGEREECAAAAGHKGPWLSKWIHGDLSATLDELVAVARFTHIPLMKVTRTGDLDVTDVALFARIQTLPERWRDLAARGVEELASQAAAAGRLRESAERPERSQRPERAVAAGAGKGRGKRRGV